MNIFKVGDRVKLINDLSRISDAYKDEIGVILDILDSVVLGRVVSSARVSFPHRNEWFYTDHLTHDIDPIERVTILETLDL